MLLRKYFKVPFYILCGCTFLVLLISITALIYQTVKGYIGFNQTAIILNSCNSYLQKKYNNSFKLISVSLIAICLITLFSIAITSYLIFISIKLFRRSEILADDQTQTQITPQKIYVLYIGYSLLLLPSILYFGIFLAFVVELGKCISTSTDNIILFSLAVVIFVLLLIPWIIVLIWNIIINNFRDDHPQLENLKQIGQYQMQNMKTNQSNMDRPLLILNTTQEDGRLNKTYQGINKTYIDHYQGIQDQNYKRDKKYDNARINNDRIAKQDENNLGRQYLGRQSENKINNNDKVRKQYSNNITPRGRQYQNIPSTDSNQRYSNQKDFVGLKNINNSLPNNHNIIVSPPGRDLERDFVSSRPDYIKEQKYIKYIEKQSIPHQSKDNSLGSPHFNDPNNKINISMKSPINKLDDQQFENPNESQLFHKKKFQLKNQQSPLKRYIEQQQQKNQQKVSRFHQMSTKLQQDPPGKLFYHKRKTDNKSISKRRLYQQQQSYLEENSYKSILPQQGGIRQIDNHHHHHALETLPDMKKKIKLQENFRNQKSFHKKSSALIDIIRSKYVD